MHFFFVFYDISLYRHLWHTAETIVCFVSHCESVLFTVWLRVTSYDWYPRESVDKLPRFSSMIWGSLTLGLCNIRGGACIRWVWVQPSDPAPEDFPWGLSLRDSPTSTLTILGNKPEHVDLWVIVKSTAKLGILATCLLTLSMPRTWHFTSCLLFDLNVLGLLLFSFLFLWWFRASLVFIFWFPRGSLFNGVRPFFIVWETTPCSELPTSRLLMVQDKSWQVVFSNFTWFLIGPKGRPTVCCLFSASLWIFHFYCSHRIMVGKGVRHNFSNSLILICDIAWDLSWELSVLQEKALLRGGHSFPF